MNVPASSLALCHSSIHLMRTGFGAMSRCLWAAVIILAGLAGTSSAQTTEDYSGGGIVGTVSNAISPVVSSGGGFTFTVVASSTAGGSSGGSGTINNPGVPLGLNMIVSGSPVSYPVYMKITMGGTAFKLYNLVCQAGTAAWDQSTMVGYLGGNPVIGATSTSPFAGLGINATWDVSGISAFQNVDEIRILPNTTSTSSGRFSLESISYGAAVTTSTPAIVVHNGANASAPTLTATYAWQTMASSGAPSRGGFELGSRVHRSHRHYCYRQ